MNDALNFQFQFDETDQSNTEYIQDMLNHYEKFKARTTPKKEVSINHHKSTGKQLK